MRESTQISHKNRTSYISSNHEWEGNGKQMQLMTMFQHSICDINWLAIWSMPFVASYAISILFSYRYTIHMLSDTIHILSVYYPYAISILVVIFSVYLWDIIRDAMMLGTVEFSIFQ